MGKGDIRSGKGKRFAGSYGKTRKRKSSPVAEVAAAKPATKAEAKTPKAEKPAKAASPAAKEKKAPAKKATKKPAEG